MRKFLGPVVLNLFAWTTILAVAFPLFWMLVTSVKPQSELFRRPPTMLPESWTFEHYWHLLTQTNFLVYFRNSVMLSVNGGVKTGHGAAQKSATVAHA